MNTFKKFVASSVVVSTVLSMAVVVAPVKAATATAGDLIKQSGNSSVYYLGADSKRYVFPNEATYKSWYNDFSLVKVIPQAELESYGIGGNVTIRPGTKLVKITTNPKVYAVEPGGSLKAIPDEATAKTLYGADWAKRVVDVPDAFFINYKDSGAALAAGKYPAGSLVKFSATAPDVYYINADGTASKIATEAAFNASRFQFANVLDGSAVTMPALGAEVTGAIATDLASSNGGTTYVGGSGVTVALAGTTPASASVPKNGSRIPMAKVNLTAASDGAVTVSSITVKRIGLSSYSEINQVWAEKAGVIVATKKALSSNDEAILTFAPALTIAAGQTVTLDLLASLNNASGNIGLGIASAASVVTTGAAVSGSFPIYGNIMAPVAYDVANLAFTTTNATNTVKVGDEKAELGRFTLDFNTTVAAKDINVTSVMLKNNGAEDLAKTSMNLFLEVAGQKISDRAVVDGRYVTFYFAAGGYDLLKDNGAKTFVVKGDIIAKENTAANSYTFVLNKGTDVVASEKSTGYGVNVYNATSGTTAADNTTVSRVVITAGAITVTKKSTSPADTTIIKGADNTVLVATIKADEAINVDGLNVKYGSTATGAETVDQFENVRVYVNGSLIGTIEPTATSATLISKAIDSALTLNKGDNEVKVMARAKTNANSGSAFKAVLDSANLFSGMNPEYVSSRNAVSGDISGSATGGIFTVQGAGLIVVKNDGYTNGKVIVKGASNVSLGKFTIKASNDDVTVTSIVLGANTGSTSASNINDAKVFVDGVQVGNTVDFASNGATFSGLNFVVAKDKSKQIEIKASFDSSANGTFSTTMTVNANDSRGTQLIDNNGSVNLDGTTALFNVVASGTLAVALGGDTPVDAILTAPAATAAPVAKEIAQVKFTATNDAATLVEVNFVNTSSSTAAVATSSADNAIQYVELYDGTTLLDSTNLVNGAAKFYNANGLVTVSAATPKTLSVRVKLNPIADENGTDKDIRFAMQSVDFKSSDGTLTDNQSAVVIAKAFRVRNTVPTVALQALSGTLANGEQVVSKFTVTADAGADVTLRKVVLTYATSGAASLSGLTGNGITVNGTAKAVNTAVVGNTVVVDFGSNYEVIAAGKTKTFEILATVSTDNDKDSITTKIAEDAAYGATGSFEWSDGSSNSVYTWSNGHRVLGLPTQTQNLSN